MDDGPTIKETAALISISAINSSHDDERWIRIILKSDRQKIAEITLTANTLGETLTGLSDRPCAIELRDVFDSIEGIEPEWARKRRINETQRD